MTDSEYLSQRKELENRIAQLDAAHLNDREYMDGDHVHIDIGWESVRGVICGCYIEKADGSIHYYYHPLKKDGTPRKAVRSTFVGCKLTKL